MAVEWKREGTVFWATQASAGVSLHLNRRGKGWRIYSNVTREYPDQQITIAFESVCSQQPTPGQWFMGEIEGPQPEAESTSPDEQLARLEAQLEAALQFVRAARATPLPE